MKIILGILGLIGIYIMLTCFTPQAVKKPLFTGIQSESKTYYMLRSPNSNEVGYITDDYTEVMNKTYIKLKEVERR